MHIPANLRRGLSGWSSDVAEDWLSKLPGYIVDAERRWGISIGDPFEPGGDTSYVAPATTQSGGSVVYKCTVPHDEAVGEALALSMYNGDGAVRVIESRPDSCEVLIERCKPGESLWTVPTFDERAEIACGLMQRLWTGADNDPRTIDIATLQEFGIRWSAVTQRRLIEYELPWIPDPIERGADLIQQLPYTADSDVLLHQDFHPANVLSASREPWLVIDPKPVLGDPYFEPVHLLVQAGGSPSEPPPRAEIEARLDLISSLLRFDPERIALWAIARTAEWSMWSYEKGGTVDAAITYTWARTLDAMFPA